MKKYIVAGMVAVMAFAFAAFAASLNVDAGVLQAGVDDDLTCTDSAEVEFQTGTNPVTDNYEFKVSSITVTFDSTGCDGEYAHLRLNNTPYASGVNPDSFMIKQITGDEVVFPIDPAASPAGKVLAKDIEVVSLLVRSGLQGGEFSGYSSGVFGMNLTP